jgi:hypothetical protein
MCLALSSFTSLYKQIDILVFFGASLYTHSQLVPFQQNVGDLIHNKLCELLPLRSNTVPQAAQVHGHYGAGGV